MALHAFAKRDTTHTYVMPASFTLLLLLLLL
jgi:hypothetical protein